MEHLSIVRQLRALYRTTLMLQTELRNGLVDGPLIARIESHMENGIATTPHCSHLVPLVDSLREGLLTPRKELHSDAIRACEKLKDGIETALGRS